MQNAHVTSNGMINERPGSPTSFLSLIAPIGPYETRSNHISVDSNLNLNQEASIHRSEITKMALSFSQMKQ